MEIRTIQSPSIHVQPLQNTIQRIHPKRKTQIHTKAPKRKRLHKSLITGKNCIQVHERPYT